jgi:hypothetical protein
MSNKPIAVGRRYVSLDRAVTAADRKHPDADIRIKKNFDGRPLINEGCCVIEAVEVDRDIVKVTEYDYDLRENQVIRCRPQPTAQAFWIASSSSPGE